MTPSTALALKLARIVGGLGIFAFGWYLTSDMQHAAAIVSMGVATAATIGGAYAASLMLEPAPGDTAQTSFPVPAPVSAPAPAGQTSQDQALADLLGLLRRGTAVPSQDWLTERWGLASKGTTSKWLSRWEAKGLVSRSQIGRCKTVS